MKNILYLLLSLATGWLGAFGYHYFSNSEEEKNTPSAGYVNNPDYNRGGNVPIHATNNRPTPTRLGGMNDDFIQASANSTPSVVFIKTVSGQQQTSLFDWFFNGSSGRRASSGSGVIFTPDGYIVTNNHVIADAENIEVIHEKRSYAAKIIGTDPSTDLAILKVDGKKLPAIKVGNSRQTQVGEWVLAVGNPFNLTSTVTAGIVSAKGRNLNILSSSFPIESFIQTDAAINPGNSGGALVNLKGELIGINTAIYSQTGSYTGYGFAVPADIVEKVVGDIIKYGQVQKAIFGAEVTELDDRLADKLNTSDLNGVALKELETEGAADKAGLRNGDIILSIDGIKVNSKAEFDEELYYRSPGDKVKVSYRRNNDIKDATLTLTNTEGGTGIVKRTIFKSSKLGAQLEKISKREMQRFGLKGGVRVVKVEGNGLMRRLNISDGFIVTSINNKLIQEPEDLEEILMRAGGRIILEGVNANGQRGYYQFYF